MYEGGGQEELNGDVQWGGAGVSGAAAAVAGVAGAAVAVAGVSEAEAAAAGGSTRRRRGAGKAKAGESTQLSHEGVQVCDVAGSASEEEEEGPGEGSVRPPPRRSRRSTGREGDLHRECASKARRRETAKRRETTKRRETATTQTRAMATEGNVRKEEKETAPMKAVKKKKKTMPKKNRIRTQDHPDANPTTSQLRHSKEATYAISQKCILVTPK